MKLSKETLIDFAVLSLRWYLAFYMFDYGYGKLNGGQFGVYDPNILDKPLKDVDKFYLAWHLFSLDKTFNTIIGIMQILGAILIVINRTVLIGALMLLPILSNIFLIDLAFTTSQFKYSLVVRLFGMIVSDFLILYYYKDKMILIGQLLTQNIKTKVQYKWWIFLLMPLVGMATDFVLAIILMPIKFFLNWFTK
jgi:uncharacterized membrane protein YphA (DoxX/SURF4 family)